MSDHQRRESDAGARLGYFVIGATVGAVVALLLAPKSGRELREDLADATRKGVDRARETGTQLSTKAGEYYDAASARAGELAASAREAAARRGERVSAAIDAGRQAYRDEKQRTESSLNEEPPALGGGE
ncbi:MAG TPA: YtxH domain-containing protein [Pyrinomonadaceae bacterium]|jgi:gas vesicle protein|nr:YtxH domain-containing protein [Pyrinomonadaceae bacterium]